MPRRVVNKNKHSNMGRNARSLKIKVVVAEALVIIQNNYAHTMNA